MCRNGLERLDANGLFNVTKGVEAELVDCAERIGVLHIILDHINVVGHGEQAGKGGGFAVP